MHTPRGDEEGPGLLPVLCFCRKHGCYVLHSSRALNGRCFWTFHEQALVSLHAWHRSLMAMETPVGCLALPTSTTAATPQPTTSCSTSTRTLHWPKQTFILMLICWSLTNQSSPFQQLVPLAWTALGTSMFQLPARTAPQVCLLLGSIDE